MEIIEVRQNWPDDVLRIDLTIGNYCNYKCWYCWPGCHEGDRRWPNFEIFTKNLCHLMDHYLKTTNKKKFDFHVMGGEVTHWPKFIEFIQFFKSRYDCIFTLTTNGSKKIEFWEKAIPHLDYVNMSVHHEFCDPAHISNVADLLYKNNVIVTTLVLMDPNNWDRCVSIVNQLKKSKHSWSIRYLEIINDTVSYTEEQKKVLNKLRARRSNPFWFFKNNKSYQSKVKVLDVNNKVSKIGDHVIVFDRLNKFKDWECSVGVHWIAVKSDGIVSAICGNGLYKDSYIYSIFEEEFVEKFNPTVQPTICKQDDCWCIFEANMPKRKIIPIYKN